MAIPLECLARPDAAFHDWAHNEMQCLDAMRVRSLFGTPDPSLRPTNLFKSPTFNTQLIKRPTHYHPSSLVHNSVNKPHPPAQVTY